MTEAKTAQNAPYVQEESAGKKVWCACGLSQKQPFCDGAHSGTSFRPVLVEVEEGKTVAWCGCKKTKTPPYCDGSHNSAV